MDRFVARTDDIVMEELDAGLVIYDGREAQAHWLDPSATAVWRACREPSTEADIADAAGVERPTCELVLSQLIDLGLVEAESGPGYSRRAVLRTAAKVGLAGAISAPIISAVVPAAAAAASVLPPQPPTPPPAPQPGTITQATNAEQTFVPGAPSVSDVTVTVGVGNGSGGGSGGTKHRPTGFSIDRATVNRHGLIVLTLSAQSAGGFKARASFRTVGDRSKKRPHPHGLYGSGSAVLGRRGSVKLTIVPTRAAARALAAKKHLALSIPITFTPVAGAGRTATATLTIS